MKIINCWSITMNKGGTTQPGDIVVIYRKDGEKKIQVIRNFDWYFYVLNSAKAIEVLEYLKSQGLIRKWVEGKKKFIKVYCDKKTYRDKNVLESINILHSKDIQTYEADIGPAKRFLLDKNFELEDFKNINLWYFDIETDDSSGKIEYKTKGAFTEIDSKDRILSIAAVNREGREIFMYAPPTGDEKVLLEEFNDFLKRESVDMLVGWNSKDFDIPYIAGRMEKHKVNNTMIRNILHEDLMKRVQYFYLKDPEARQTITSYSLNNISKYFLDETKIDRPGKVIDLMKEDFKTFRDYNLQDCHLVRKLEEKLGLIDLTYQMFQMCQCTAQNWSMVKALDNFILSEANKQGIHYPTNASYITKEDIDDESQYLGAFVLDPIPGYYENVYDLDFKSLYPNIIRTFNISPDSKMKKIAGIDLIETPGVTIDGIVRGKCYFDDDQQGVIPKKIALLLEERAKIRTEQKKAKKNSQEWRDLNVKQLVVKELANSVYGIIGNKYFRGFSIDLAESITGTGQYLIKWLQSYFNSSGDPKSDDGGTRKKGHEPNECHDDGLGNDESLSAIDERKAIYGDTDSIFVTIKNEEDIAKVLLDCNRDLEKHLRETFNVSDYTIELDLDKVFDKFLIISKKKYVGMSEGKMEIKGMECIKRDNIEIANEYQKRVIDEIFGDIPREIMEAKIVHMRQSILEGSIDPKKLAVTKKLGKDADLYRKEDRADGSPGVLPLWVRVSKSVKKNTKENKTDITKKGSIIQYIHTNGSSEAIHISEFTGEYDREHYWNKLIYPQIERILKVVFPKTDWSVYYKTNKIIKHDNIRRSIDDNEEPSITSNRLPRRRKKDADIL